MQTSFMKLGVAAAAAMLMAGAAQAALQDRDLDGDTVVDAFYDTDLNITWLRDANVNGVMNWASAVAWADGFSFGGLSDWRLPASDTSCSFSNCTGSEMGHLYYVELGNSFGSPPMNTGDFQNLPHNDSAWSGTDYSSDGPRGGFAWVFDLMVGGGQQGLDLKDQPGYAMAVRPGDVPAVPEPETYALMLVGLAAVALARRQRRR